MSAITSVFNDGVFAEQVQMAHELDLPLVIHTRDAWDDTFAVLDDLGTPTA